MTANLEIKAENLTAEQSALMAKFTIDYLQNLIYEFGAIAIEKFPQLANDDPQKIGELAKKAAFAFMTEALA